MDLSTIINVLVNTIQGIAVLLILAGMITAFLWKISGIINSIMGFIITLLLTYLAYTFTQNILTTIFVFVMCLGALQVIVALGALLCFFEGFALSAFGFWGYFVAGSPSNAFTPGTIVLSLIASTISTIVAIFIGGRILSAVALDFGNKPLGLIGSFKFLIGKKNTAPSHKQTIKKEPLKVQIISDNTPKEPVVNKSKTVVPLTKEQYLQKQESITRQLSNLEIETQKGTIAPSVADKLRKELQVDLEADKSAFLESSKIELDKIDRELYLLNSDLSFYEQQKKELNEQNDELDARLRIGQITKQECDNKRYAISQKINFYEQKKIGRNEKINELTKARTLLNSFIAQIEKKPIQDQKEPIKRN